VSAYVHPAPLQAVLGRSGTRWASAAQRSLLPAQARVLQRADGLGRISGTVKVLTAPASRKVRLYDRATGELLREVQSGVDGTYRFERLALSRQYFVLAFDGFDQPLYNAAVADSVQAGLG
jgi:hypothetical protein